MAGPLAVAVAVALLLLFRGAQASILASGKLETCLNDGSESLNCTSKVVVSLTLDNNRAHATERLDFEVSCVGSPTGRCPCPCYWRDDPACACRDLAQTISVSATKSPVYAVYPLSQPRLVNGRPTEARVTTGAGGSGGRACRDGAADAAPTCGWARAPDANGVLQAVPDSQGFCCRCPAWGGAPVERGGLGCSYALSWIAGGAPASAHCLRYDDDWWYRAYAIGEYQLDFDIELAVNTTTPADGGGAPASSEVEALALGPSASLARSARGAVAARLLGDLAAYRQVQVLARHTLLVPAPPGWDPNAALSGNLDQWLVVPPEAVAPEGGCDAVGVTHAAFRAHGGAGGCGRPYGSCLRRQVVDLIWEDEDRAAAGLAPLYNVTRYGGGLANARQVQRAASGGGLALWLPLRGVQASVVQLEVAADAARLVVNRAPARIEAFSVCTFDRASCGGFQALAARGLLDVTVRNTGAVAAEYRVGAVGCGDGVLPVLEETGSLAPGEARVFTLELLADSDAAGNRTCTLRVADAATGALADAADVAFFTSATEYETPPEQGDLGGGEDPPGGAPPARTCAQRCPLLWEVRCALLAGCLWHVARAVAAAVGAVALIAALLVALRRGWVTGAVLGCARLLARPARAYCRQPTAAPPPPPPPPPPAPAAFPAALPGAGKAAKKTAYALDADGGGGGGARGPLAAGAGAASPQRELLIGAWPGAAPDAAPGAVLPPWRTPPPPPPAAAGAAAGAARASPWAAFSPPPPLPQHAQPQHAAGASAAAAPQRPPPPLQQQHGAWGAGPPPAAAGGVRAGGLVMWTNPVALEPAGSEGDDDDDGGGAALTVRERLRPMQPPVPPLELARVRAAEPGAAGARREEPLLRGDAQDLL